MREVPGSIPGAALYFDLVQIEPAGKSAFAGQRGLQHVLLVTAQARLCVGHHAGQCSSETSLHQHLAVRFNQLACETRAQEVTTTVQATLKLDS